MSYDVNIKKKDVSRFTTINIDLNVKLKECNISPNNIEDINILDVKLPPKIQTEGLVNCVGNIK
jgi:hypothetical protein